MAQVLSQTGGIHIQIHMGDLAAVFASSPVTISCDGVGSKEICIFDRLMVN